MSLIERKTWWERERKYLSPAFSPFSKNVFETLFLNWLHPGWFVKSEYCSIKLSACQDFDILSGMLVHFIHISID